MGLWHKNPAGAVKQFMPSDYVFDNMDTDVAKAMLGRLLDLMWERGKLSDDDVIEIIGYSGLSTTPPEDIKPGA